MPFAQISYFNKERGFGFLDTKEGRLFFHISHYERPEVVVRPAWRGAASQPEVVFSEAPAPVDALKPGTWLHYVTAKGPKGLMAGMWCLREESEAASETLARYPVYRLTVRGWRSGLPVQNHKLRAWVETATLHERNLWTGYNLDDVPYWCRLNPDEQAQLWCGEELRNDLMPGRFRTPQDLFDLPVGQQRERVLTSR